MRKLLLLSLVLCSACSKGPQADLPSIGEARSLAAEWALINRQAAEQKLTRAYVETMHASIREQLQAAAEALTEPNSVYGAQIQALLKEPDDASPRQLSGHADALKQIEDQLESLELTLGIMTAVGGFVDISELVFAARAGSTFGYALIWVFALATGGIMVFGEMSGRVAAVAKQPVFNLMRHRLGIKLGLITLAASLVANLITCAAELGGVALILRYLTGGSYPLLAIAGTGVLMASMWVLPFKWIERIYGLLGLFMIAFIAALVAIHAPWGKIAGGFVPQVPHGLSPKDLLLFGYFAVAIVSAVMFPYEAYFYSSGGIEEEWGPKDLPMNKVTCTLGFGLGSLLSISILASSAQLFTPANVDPQLLGSSALEVAIPFGWIGLVIALLGMLFAISGAAIETCMANAYSISQFFGWEWGRHRKPWDAPRFTIAWMALFILALAIILTGVDPMQLVEYAVLFSILVLPLTYLPLLLLAGDKSYMKQYANGRVGTTLGWFYFALITVAAVGALPLYFLTSGGQG